MICTTRSRRRGCAGTVRPRLALRAPEALEPRLLMAVITVNSDADILSPPAGTVTLRSAIQAANASPGADTIVIPTAGNYRITTFSTLQDNSAGELDIADNGNLTIQNTSGGDVAIVGNGSNRVLGIDPLATAAPFTVTLVGLDITGGMTFGNGGGIVAGGGSSLVLSGCIVSGNLAGNGGGIGILSNASGTQTLNNTQVIRNLATQTGGGIFDNGTGTMTIGSQSVIANNTAAAASGGGGVAVNGPSLAVSGARISGNRALGGPGGGIAQGGNKSVVISGSIIEDNSSSTVGGGYADVGGTATLTATNSFLLDNSATTSGGGISAGGTLTRLVNTTLAGNSSMKGGGADFPSGTAALVDSTVSDNMSSGGGGGLSSDGTTQLNLTGCTIRGNLTGGGGGGVFASITGGGVSVNNCLFVGNAALGVGGGLFEESGGALNIDHSQFTGNRASVGAGLELLPSSFDIEDTTVDHNTSSGRAAGVFVNVGASSDTFRNDTIVDNSANGSAPGGEGGGIDFFRGAATVAIIDCTVAGNSTAANGGGGIIMLAGTNTVNISGHDHRQQHDGRRPVRLHLHRRHAQRPRRQPARQPGRRRRQVRRGHDRRRPEARPARRQRRPGAPARPSTSQIHPDPGLAPRQPRLRQGRRRRRADDRRARLRPAAKPSIGAYEPQYATNATANQVFVENLFEVLLNRVADAGSLANAVNYLNGGGAGVTLVQILQGSAEFRGIEATQVFRRYLDRAPSPAEQGNVANYLAAATPEQLAAFLVEQPEFFDDYGNSTDVFVEALYGDILDRAAIRIRTCRLGPAHHQQRDPGGRGGDLPRPDRLPRPAHRLPTTPPTSVGYLRSPSRPTWPRCGPASTASRSRPSCLATARPSPGGPDANAARRRVAVRD